ncbi:TMhelix containing protein [Vibrio phage 1.152.O._10N.222.46.E1]|uniref:TMhelix containing protein n=5 Tax=Nahantvirus 49C7 TaxID=2846601 RepID=A0A2I7RB96_9CAUD|nr:TMhelix containing protein [Vibrio phage 1.026.O._10N.222.49.C7]AUR82506.1 TMhelix containing protein [Vibrio phage 1.025.O._10N.222.46.B6]AUR90756.1 TMhelix containing protein [Vibrio phage 1.150.O._10N.222.46.A6]AUR90929.1 TMhelix containing protein [Vibrio phage 1.152.O._10N.222.46.E1]AUS02397.1 TMhelix containing protein [Vibrio phage 2.130.O._10N.222.46.C2]AUR82614.1 TMhelix containing protein [Vibrio phage 1.026.O._10N.222.49.C7]
MGKYAISVASYATNINDISGNPTKNTISSICHKREVGDHKSVNSSLLGAMHNGLAVRVNSGIKYGRDEYVYGLPEGYVVTTEIDIETVQDVISEELGTEVVINAAFIAPPDPDYFARWYSYENWGGDPLTGYMSNPPVNGSDIEISDAAWTNYTGLEMLLTYSRDGIPKNKTFIENSPVPVDLTKQYYQVIYTREDTVSPTSDFWIYELGTNTIPELEVVVEEYLDSPFLPVVPVRENNINLGPEAEDGEFIYDENGQKIVPDTELYRTSVKLCEKFRIGFDDIAREITGNEDVDSIDHSYIIFGIDIRSDTKPGKTYLFDFFEKLAFSTIGSSEIEVRDAQYYKIRLTFDSCTSSDEVGELDEVEVEYSGNIMYLRAPTDPGMYREITVVNPVHINFVYQNHTVITTLEDSADEENYNFIVPLDYFEAQNAGSLFDRERLYIEAAKLVFNCYEKKKLKWYQRGWFKVVLIVIAVVITVFTGVGGAFVAALEAGIAATVLFLVEAVLISSLIKYGFQMLVDVLGIEIGILLAIVAAVASFMVGDATGILSAENLMTASSGFVMGSDASLSADMEKLADDMATWTEEAAALDKELNEAFEELNTDTFFNAYDFINAGNIFIPNEVPEEYFNRTIHTGNIGVGVLSVPEHYVDNALTLPTVSRFMGYEDTEDGV